MKNEIQAMDLPEIKRMLRWRRISKFLFIVLSALTIILAFGKQVLLWPWAGLNPLITLCLALALVSIAGFLTLKSKLASGGL